VLQAATNVTPPITWQSVFTKVADASGNWWFTNSFLQSAPVLFYRLSMP
jgi:hypothetical protein